MKTIKLYIFGLGCSLLSLAAWAQPGQMDLESGKLKDAKAANDGALTNEKQIAKPKYWITRGKIHAAIAADAGYKQYGGLYAALDADKKALFTAVDCYKKAMELDPEKKNPYKDAQAAYGELYQIALNYGISMYQAGDVETAVKALAVAQEANPKELIAFAYGAELAREVKNWDVMRKSLENLVNRPMADFNEYNAKVPADKPQQRLEKSRYYLLLADYYKNEAKDLDKALEVGKKGLAENPNDKDLRGYLLDIQFKTGKIDEAVKSAEELAKQNPNDPDAYYNLAIVYEKANKMDDALRAYEQSAKLKPSFNATFNTGALYYQKGKNIMDELNKLDLADYKTKVKTEKPKAEVEFKKALPYFEQLYADKSLDKDNKIRVLQALSEIYRIIEDKAKYEQFSKELKALDN